MALFQIISNCFGFLLKKHTSELDAVFQHPFCCWYMYLKIKNYSSKSACFSCPCSKTPSHPSPPAVCRALLGVSAQSKILHSNEFSRCPTSRRLKISSRYSPVFSQHPFWANALFCCVFVDLGRWRKKGYLGLITVFMKTKKFNVFSAKLVFNSLKTSEAFKFRCPQTLGQIDRL